MTTLTSGMCTPVGNFTISYILEASWTPPPFISYSIVIFWPKVKNYKWAQAGSSYNIWKLLGTSVFPLKM